MASFELLLCIALILISGFLSSSEIALFSLSRFQIRALKDQIPARLFKQIRKLLQDPGGLLVSILVLNEIVNITLTSVITRSVESGDWRADLIRSSVITTLIILLFCEITPKVIGAKINRLIATASISPIATIYGIMKPIRFALTRIVYGLSRESPVLKESEFLLLLEEGQREGTIQKSEVDLIKNVFDFDDTRVEDILTPLSQVKCLQSDSTVRTALSTSRGLRYSRIPVLTQNRGQIAGILYTKDMLRAKLEPELLDAPISTLMRKPLVVQPSMQLNALFRRFKQNRTHMAIVQRTTGETLGIITMNDVLQSLFEDLLE